MARIRRMSEPSVDPETLSRRRFLRSAGGVAAGGVLVHGLLDSAEAAPSAASTPAGETLEGEIEIELSING